VEILAFYLPQFHPIPENDEWWEPGFTEWANVVQARPLFRHHHQPRLPADLGFYDLRVPEVRIAQAELARAHGVTGFIYWHYWFGGRKLLERPFEEVVATGRPDFPFCVAWANHSWNDTWLGGPPRLLLEQTYPGPEDDIAHFKYLQTAFEDPRYIRVDGKPLLFIFRPGMVPDLAGFVDTWQRLAESLGGLYLVACGPYLDLQATAEAGIDAVAYISKPFATDRATSRMRTFLRNHHLRRGPHRFTYADYCTSTPDYDLPCAPVPCVWPNWDDTPRRGRLGVVAVDSNPERFERQVASALTIARRAPEAEQMLVIKSWNEWAEGNYMEPDQQFGLGWLEALARGVGVGHGDTHHGASGPATP
jgi:lipopolysaccharide biosynthesis protein